MTAAKSTPVPSKAHEIQHEPPVASAPPSADSPVAAENAVAAGSSLNSLLFPLALTVLAVLPVALGIGAIRVKASASPAIEEVVEEFDEVDSYKSPVMLDRRLGDREFLARRYEVALQYYQTLGSSQPERLPAELLYRIALCQEGLGLWSEALGSFRTVSGSTDSPTIKAAADFGLARIHLRLNEPQSAIELLQSLQLHAGEDAALPRSLKKECEFLLPISLTSHFLAANSHSKADQGTQVGELIVWSLEAALAWCDEPTVVTELSVESPADAETPTNVPQCRLVESSPTSMDQNTKPNDKNANEQSVLGISVKNQSIEQVLESIAAECGWKLNRSEFSGDESLGRKVCFQSDNFPVSSVLTLVCSEIRATWTLENRQLTIRRVNNDQSQIRRMLETTLTSLIDWAPNYRLVSHVRFLQAQLAELSGDFSAAARLYSSIVGRDTSSLTIRSAYNAARHFVNLNEYARACFYLDIVVNGAPGHELHVESLILLGRLLLDRGLAQDAVFQLRRATEARTHSVQQARAGALLGLAYLTQDRYMEAAEAILENRNYFEDPEARNVAAFVTAYSRWHSVTGEMQSRESSYLFRALAVVNVDAEWFGQAGRLLVGRALSEIGNDERMADLYSQALAKNPTDFVEPELMFSLANYEYAKGRTDSAAEKWTKVANSAMVQWANRARMRIAEAALNENRARDCVQSCNAIKSYEGIVRSDLCKLMGKAYERLGEDNLAARCYAGQLPNP